MPDNTAIIRFERDIYIVKHDYVCRTFFFRISFLYIQIQYLKLNLYTIHIMRFLQMKKKKKNTKNMISKLLG